MEKFRSEKKNWSAIFFFRMVNTSGRKQENYANVALSLRFYNWPPGTIRDKKYRSKMARLQDHETVSTDTHFHDFYSNPFGRISRLENLFSIPKGSADKNEVSVEKTMQIERPRSCQPFSANYHEANYHN